MVEVKLGPRMTEMKLLGEFIVLGDVLGSLNPHVMLHTIDLVFQIVT